jgi:hypothetical protein
VAKPTRPLRIIELITLFVIAGLIIAITLPRCAPPASHNQPPAVTAP